MFSDILGCPFVHRLRIGRFVVLNSGSYACDITLRALASIFLLVFASGVGLLLKYENLISIGYVRQSKPDIVIHSAVGVYRATK